MTIPATSRVSEIDTSSGRNEGGGMWTPAGGVPAGAGRAPTGAACSAATDGRWSYSRSASRPQYSSVITRTSRPAHSQGPPANSPNRSMNAPKAANSGANDGPGMWMPSGVTGVCRR